MKSEKAREIIEELRRYMQEDGETETVEAYTVCLASLWTVRQIKSLCRTSKDGQIKADILLDLIERIENHED